MNQNSNISSKICVWPASEICIFPGKENYHHFNENDSNDSDDSNELIVNIE